MMIIIRNGCNRVQEVISGFFYYRMYLCIGHTKVMIVLQIIFMAIAIRKMYGKKGYSSLCLRRVAN